ncbi:MAG TPA: hypothetical protein VGH34_24310 [Vicinamibacterales bacterium]
MRIAVAFGIVSALALPLSVSAQGGSIGLQTGRQPAGARPVSRPSTVAKPRGTITTVPLYPAARTHRPICFRSSYLGLVVFDPYWWPGPEVDEQAASPGPRLMGGLQLDVEPRSALVYVDGFFAGTVDQYKGYFQHLDATAGYHTLEFVSPNFEPLVGGVTVVPNQTTTYRGFLNRASGR